MYCLHCGDCCKTLSPFSEEPCKFLTEVKGFFFCSEYKNRPEQCKNHTYPYRFCLIGLDVLKLNDVDKIRERIDTGYELTITGGKDPPTPPPGDMSNLSVSGSGDPRQPSEQKGNAGTQGTECG